MTELASPPTSAPADTVLDEPRARSGAAAGPPRSAPAATQFATLTMRHVRALLRQPAYLAISLVQAVVWLPLFGSVFRSVAHVPGFGGGDYIAYLTPGVAVMSALFSSGWAGMSFIIDMDRGVMDRLLASPARRSAIVGSSLVYVAIQTAIQTAIIMLLGWALGTHFSSGLPGVLVFILVTVVLGMAVAGLSDALALLVRKEESLIAATNFLVLPLTFLSTATMQRNLLPGWIQDVARCNPVDWAVSAAREAIAADPDWGYVAAHAGYLAALAFVAGTLATRAFRAYQRSL
jgi:ABC-2 type transport system permease protein